jgi:TPR repeat protein
MACIARPALAICLSFSLLSLTSVAQPLAQPSTQPAAQRGTQQYPEDQPGFPQYPGAGTQSAPPRSTRVAAAAAGKASLNFPPDRNDAVAMQCDQLADEPADPQRVDNGVAFEKIDADQALPVCEQAARRQPARARYQYLYGRVLSAARRYEDAVIEFTSADRGGYAFASLSLAHLYDRGRGVTMNWEEALRLYFRAGNAGMPDAFTSGAEIYMDENPPYYAQAKSWLEYAVQGGSSDGMADLGWLYETGNGVARNPVTAANLYNQAAKGGSSEGLFRAGLAYREGMGVQKDAAAGCQMLIQAAEASHDYAEQEAGRCYYNGIGVDQDHAAAFNWFAKAGQAGLVDAQVFAADMLERGDGWNQDSASAVLWYQAAAERGSAYAMTELGAHLRLGKGIAWSEAQAMQWFAKAAQKGYVPAETSLAVGYENGLGQDSGQGRQDYRQAAYWFDKAANQDDGYAQLNLGVMYEKGWGVPQNLERAKQLYARAAGSSDTAVAKLGSEYFSDVPASASPDSTPQRSVAGSSKDSSAFWGLVVLGVLAVGAASMLSSGGSSSGNASIGTGSSSDPPKWDRDYGKNCSAEVGNWGVSSQQPVFCQY